MDLLTPGDRVRSGKPLQVGRFNVAAAPMRYLELAREDAQPAAVVNGGGVLVAVPHPARFAIMNLLVAQDRPSAFQARADKDVAQAVQLIAALEELRPGEVRIAWRAARARGKGWATALERGAALLERRSPALAARVSNHT